MARCVRLEHIIILFFLINLRKVVAELRALTDLVYGFKHEWSESCFISLSLQPHFPLFVSLNSYSKRRQQQRRPELCTKQHRFKATTSAQTQHTQTHTSVVYTAYINHSCSHCKENHFRRGQTPQTYTLKQLKHFFPIRFIYIFQCMYFVLIEILPLNLFLRIVPLFFPEISLQYFQKFTPLALNKLFSLRTNIYCSNSGARFKILSKRRVPCFNIGQFRVKKAPSPTQPKHGDAAAAPLARPLTHLSRAMQHRCRMDAVVSSTSSDVRTRQKVSP